LAEVGSVADIKASDGIVVTRDGLKFVLATDDSDCGSSLAEVAGMLALADWETGKVVALVCMFGA
jgi:hypothetical protein